MGDTPGQYADQGHPSAKAARKFDEWLQKAGLTKPLLYLTTILKCQGPEYFPEVLPGGPVDRCRPFLQRQLALLNPVAILILGKRPMEHWVLPGTGEQANPFDKWAGKVCRRRDLFGETRLAVAWPPAHIVRNKNPREEEQSLQAIRALSTYVTARLLGEPAPTGEVIDLYSAPPLSFQQRLPLFGPQSSA